MKLNIYRCLKCGHYWTSKEDALPTKCPKCSSEKWNELQKVISVPYGRIVKQKILDLTKSD